MNLNEKLTRDLAFKENMDPKGNKWGIGKVIGTALYRISNLEGPAREAPNGLRGKFTNPTLAQKAIEKFLAEAWDENDAYIQKATRKAHKEEVTEE